MARDIKEWRELDSKEQCEAWKKWNPYTDADLAHLMSQILTSFQEEHPQLSVSWGNVHGESQLVVKSPGKSQLPPYLGIPVRRIPSIK